MIGGRKSHSRRNAEEAGENGGRVRNG